MVTVVQGKVCAKNHPDRLSRLATIHQRYRRTDGRTDFLWHRPDLTVGQKLSLCYSIVYCYNGAQTYEQFLQVGRLYRALILLGLALCLPSVFGLHGAIYLVWPHQSCWSTCAAIGLVGHQSSKKPIRDCFSRCRPFLKVFTVLAFTVWWSKLFHLLTVSKNFPSLNGHNSNTYSNAIHQFL